MDKFDLEILKFKKVQELISRGISFNEANNLAEENLKIRWNQINEEDKRLNEEERGMEGGKIITGDEQKEIKRLKRKLAIKFHPDLENGNSEIMKRINKAYAEGDIETLRLIEQEEIFEDDNNENTIESLRKKLSELENAIRKLDFEYEQLKKSEWYIWKENIENAKKQKRDLFAELEEKILQDIERKENLLTNLKNQYG